MSKFKYEWQVGDKFKVPSQGIKGRVTDFKGSSLNFRHLESASTANGDADGWRPKVGETDRYYYAARCEVNLKPLGKKTKARYQAAKRAWEAEQGKPALPIGSYATVTTLDQTGWCPRKEIPVGAKVKVLKDRESDGEYFVKDLSAEVVDNGEWFVHEDQLEPLKTVWDLQEGDTCFTLTATGGIHTGVFRINHSCNETFHARARGNLFLTREEAEAADAERVAAVKESR